MLLVSFVVDHVTTTNCNIYPQIYPLFRLFNGDIFPEIKNQIHLKLFRVDDGMKQGRISVNILEECFVAYQIELIMDMTLQISIEEELGFE